MVSPVATLSSTFRFLIEQIRVGMKD